MHRKEEVINLRSFKKVIDEFRKRLRQIESMLAERIPSITYNHMFAKNNFHHLYCKKKPFKFIFISKMSKCFQNKETYTNVSYSNSYLIIQKDSL